MPRFSSRFRAAIAAALILASARGQNSNRLRRDEKRRRIVTHPVRERPASSGTGFRRLRELLARGMFAPRLDETRSLSRRLKEGDFDEFNELFENAVFGLPETKIEEEVFGADLIINLKNTRCFGLAVGDIQFESERVNDQTLTFEVKVVDLNVTCFTDYTYKFSFFPEGKGSAELYTLDNTATTELTFTSENFETGPPNGSNISKCELDINIDDIIFKGSVFNRAANLFKESIKDTIEEEVQDVACDELGSIGTSLVGDVLDLVGEFVAPHLEELPENVTDPMYFEKNLEVPDGVDLFRFNDTNTTISRWIQDAIDAANDALGSVVDDPSSPTGNGESLFINQFIRSNLLDDDRGLLIPIDDLDFVQDGGVVLDVHDNLTETIISVSNLRVFGLDTFTAFKPLTLIGNHTFQSELAWNYTTVQVDVKIDIKPSSLPDSIIESPGTEQLLENVRVTFGVEDIRTTAAFFVGFDETVVRNMELGSLLNTSQILGCAFSTLFGFEVTGLDVTIGSIQTPKLTDFISMGVNRILSESVEVAVAMYEGTLLRALPNIFQTSLRDVLNDDLIRPFLDEQQRECAPLKPISDEETPIDFRSLLLPPDVAASFGGSDQEPYGDLIRILKTSIIDRFTSSSSDGTRALLDLDIPAILETVIEGFVGSARGLEGLNELIIGPLTKAQSNQTGTLAVDGDLIDTSVNIEVGGFEADIKIRLWDARVENLDTVAAPTSLVDPVTGQPYRLDNAATAGSEKRPLRVAAKMLISIAEGSGEELSNEVDIHLNMEAVNVVLDFILKVMDQRVFQAPLGDLTNIDCWIASIATPTLDEFGIRVKGEETTVQVSDLVLSVAKLGVNVTCVSCSSPGFTEFAEMLTTSEATEATTDSANQLFEGVTEFLKGSFLQLQLDRAVSEAAKRCPRSPEYEPNFSSATYQSTEFVRQEASTSFLTAIGLAVLVVVIVVAVLMCIIRCIVRRRHARWLESLNEEETAIVRHQQTSNLIRQKEIDQSTTSMFQSPSIPVVVRWLMPVIIIGNIGFFLSGHLSLGATVNIEASLAGETISVDDFFAFSMAQSAIDIWNAGGKALALLLVLFSGLFPYSKQFATLAMWLLPPSITSASTRGSVLLWLDWIAKWSMVDIFVLVVSIAAFRVTISSPDVVFLPDNFYSVDLLVVPMWGLWSNFLAQIISQISSHFIVYYHRKIVNEAGQVLDDKQKQNELESPTVDGVGSSDTSAEILKQDALQNASQADEVSILSRHAFSRVCKPSDANKLVTRAWVNGCVVLLGVSIVVLVILGCTLPAFSLDVLGAVGIAVESGQNFEEATTYHSIFTVVQLLMDEARFLGTAGAHIGLGALSAVVVFCVLLAPIIQVFVLLYQWFAPLTMSRRMYAFRTNEILQAWQYGEVYLISIFVASWQLGPISEFMINSYCDGLSGFFSDLVLYGFLDPVDAQCFRVDSSIEPGFFFLTAGTALLTLLVTFVSKGTVQFLREHDQTAIPNVEEHEELEDEPKPKEITPCPVLFTDTFKWCLKHQRDEMPVDVHQDEVDEFVGDTI